MQKSGPNADSRMQKQFFLVAFVDEIMHHER